MANTDWVTVHVATTEMGAELVCGLLISEGLHARLGGEERAYSFGMETREVGVPKMEQQKALEILAAWEESRSAES
jgi:formate dehydrogenase assembly factor FdhD